MSIPAIVTAGDRRAAKAIYGESKAYLEIDTRPLVLHAVQALQAVPEVSEVWVVGNGERLETVFDEAARATLTKPLHLGLISFHTGRKLRWNGETERLVDDREADGHLLKSYREPWKLP